jgi:hypothetical protein
MNVNGLIRARIVLAACPVAVLAATPGSLVVRWSEQEMSRLMDGEVLLEALHEDKPGGAARVTALFRTSADVVWNIIGECKYEFVYLRGLKLCKVLEPGQNRMLIHHRVRNNWYTPTLDFTFEASRNSDNVGTVQLVNGDLVVFDAQWKMVSLPDSDGIIVTHEIRIQPRLPAPRWLVRRSLRKDLPDMLACVRGLSNASGDNRLIGADLNRCPGDFSAVMK